MNANDLLMYLKGFFENVPNPSKAQISSLRDIILQSHAVEPEKEVLPVHVHVPMAQQNYSVGSFSTSCSTGTCGKPTPDQPNVPSYIDPSHF